MNLTIILLEILSKPNSNLKIFNTKEKKTNYFVKEKYDKNIDDYF